MTIIEGILEEYTYEQQGTRRLLERVPDAHWDYKPHEKSMALGELASHIADNPNWAAAIMQQDVFELDRASYVPYKADNVAQLLEDFDKSLAGALEAMTGASDAQMFAPWKMIVDGHVAMEMPRVAVIRTMIISHTIHHRGQLDVYLRINNVPLPAIYGPSADEQPA